MLDKDRQISELQKMLEACLNEADSMSEPIVAIKICEAMELLGHIDAKQEEL